MQDNFDGNMATVHRSNSSLF